MKVAIREVIEQALSQDLFAHPAHPYTQGLLASIPRLRDQALSRLPTIEGRVPDLLDLPEGCLFASRCARVTEACRAERPTLVEEAHTQRGVACFHPVTA